MAAVMSTRLFEKWLAALIIFTSLPLLLFFVVDRELAQTDDPPTLTQQLRRQFGFDDPLVSAGDDDDSSAYAINGVVSPGSSRKKVLKTRQKFVRKFYLNGAMFATSGKQVKDGEAIWSSETRLSRYFENRHEVSTSLLHSFSPDVERRVATLFPDPRRENIFYANSPALFWDRDRERLVVILRIWLARERYEDAKALKWPDNHFNDNYFYSQTFDRWMQPLDTGHLLGIPTNGGSTIGDGPIEPRLFPAFTGKNLLISFNSAIVNEKGKLVDYTMLWDYKDNKLLYPKIYGPNPMMMPGSISSNLPRDKHWMAFNLPPSNLTDLTTHFVHNLDPLRIIECDRRFACKFTYQAGSMEKNQFNDATNHLRGGTPFVLYKWPYYVAVAHTTLFRKGWLGRYYTGNLVVLRADPKSTPPYRIVYLSNPIRIDESLLNAIPLVRFPYIKYPFLFPVGLVLENTDSAILGVHISDHSAYLFRLSGLEKIMHDVISYDSLPSSMKANGSNSSTLFESSSTVVEIADEFKDKDVVLGPNLFSRLSAMIESELEFEAGRDKSL